MNPEASNYLSTHCHICLLKGTPTLFMPLESFFRFLELLTRDEMPHLDDEACARMIAIVERLRRQNDETER